MYLLNHTAGPTGPDGPCSPDKPSSPCKYNNIYINMKTNIQSS